MSNRSLPSPDRACEHGRVGHKAFVINGTNGPFLAKKGGSSSHRWCKPVEMQAQSGDNESHWRGQSKTPKVS